MHIDTPHVVVAALATCVLTSYAWASVSADEGDAERGAKLYVERCGACHSIEDHGAGPRHRGLFGRRAGTEPGFNFSSALRESKLVWSTPTLDRWLENPTALVPGNLMVVRLANDPADRRDIITYLQVATSAK